MSSQNHHYEMEIKSTMVDFTTMAWNSNLPRWILQQSYETQIYHGRFHNHETKLESTTVEIREWDESRIHHRGNENNDIKVESTAVEKKLKRWLPFLRETITIILILD